MNVLCMSVMYAQYRSRKFGITFSNAYWFLFIFFTIEKRRYSTLYIILSAGWIKTLKIISKNKKSKK